MSKRKVNHIKKAIEEDIVRNISILEYEESSKDCLIVKSANKWMEEANERPIPNMLFNEFWYEGELCILYADTNVGKSILAVQIGESISSGNPIHNFKMEANAQRVLYLDFELSDKQLEKRYSNNFTDHYQFHQNFFRAEINPMAKIPKNFKNMEEYLCSQLGSLIEKHQAKVVIIDNLTFLNNDSEKAKYALELMKQLKRITKENGTSILVLAHTPKRDESKPISKNDLAGSKMLINFCDSAFALGFSQQEPSHRYIKQIKQRNTEHIYHVNNVMVCCLEKEHNFLQFRFMFYDGEINHLRSPGQIDLEDRDNQMKAMIAEGMTNVDIGKALGISEGAVRKRKIKLNL